MSMLQIQVLGDFRLFDDNDQSIVTLTQSRQQALLTYLLLHRNAPQARQHLAFLLWPDSSEAQALTDLRKALTHLRQASAACLVDRQAEWSQLQTAWRLATQHQAHFVCVLGEAGIGKTYLAEEMLAWAGQQGFMVARTRAYAGEGPLAYAPVVEWLRANG